MGQTGTSVKKALKKKSSETTVGCDAMKDNRNVDYYTDMFKHHKLKINIMIKDTNIDNYPISRTNTRLMIICKHIVLVDAFLK